MIEEQELDPCHQYCYSQREVGLFEDKEAEEIRSTLPIATSVIPRNLLPIAVEPRAQKGLTNSRPSSFDFPLSSIGVVSVKLDSGQRVFGIGTVVGDHHVLTCAHNLVDERYYAVEVFFIVSIEGAKGKVLKAKSWRIPDMYFNSATPGSWDIAVIELEERGAARRYGRLARKHRPTNLEYMEGARIFRLELIQEMYDRESTWAIVQQRQHGPKLLDHSYQQGSPVVLDCRDYSYFVGVYVGGPQKVIAFEDNIVSTLNQLTSTTEGHVTASKANWYFRRQARYQRSCAFISFEPPTINFHSFT